MDSYKTAACEAESEYIEKKSRFIGSISPIESESEAIAFINKIKVRYPGASHYVYAYKNLGGNIVRFSDDGEPQGTAGMPVLEVLNREELMGAVIVVTRYFGGTLLGAGGLCRAYAGTARQALDASGTAIFRKYKLYKLDCEYSLGSKLKYELPKNGAEIMGLGYTDLVNIVISVAPENDEALHRYIADVSSGRIEMQLIGEKYYA